MKQILLSSIVLIIQDCSSKRQHIQWYSLRVTNSCSSAISSSIRHWMLMRLETKMRQWSCTHRLLNWASEQ